MINLHVSSRFKKSFKKLPNKIKEDFSIKIDLFKENPFEVCLSTHKLNGKLKSYYSFYLRDGFRVMLDFMQNNEVLLINIGSHDDYKKWEKAN